MVFQCADHKMALDRVASDSSGGAGARAIICRETGSVLIKGIRDLSKAELFPDANIPTVEEWLDDVLNDTESKEWFLEQWSEP